MISARHTFTKVGHRKGAVSLLRRFFDTCKKLFDIGEDNRYRRKTKFQLSNAEYHLTATEMNKIIDAATNSRDRAILRLLAETGLRRCEIVNVRLSDIAQNGRQLTVTKGKGHKVRLVPLTQIMANEFCGLAKTDDNAFLFCSSPGTPLSMRHVNRLVAQAGITAGITNPNPKYRQITPHLFRHSFARLWKDRGGSIEALSKIMGHQSTKTTWDLYGTMSLNDIQHEYLKIMRPGKTKPVAGGNNERLPKGEEERI